MTVIGGEFAKPVELINPGQASVSLHADVWQTSGGEYDEEGTLVASFTGLFPPGTVIAPLADVLVDGRHLWVSGLPESRTSLLTGFEDHVEAPLKTVARQITLVDVVRDAVAGDRNPLGDKIDTPGIVDAAVPASIIERRTEVPTADGDLRTLTMWVGWVPIGTEVAEYDRLVVDAGTAYRVERVTHPITLGWREKRLELALQGPAPEPLLFPEVP
jgi:hypothetical protein